MQVKVHPNFPYPNMFFITGRASGEKASPVQGVGVLVVKQTLLTKGTETIEAQKQEKILMSDQKYPEPTTSQKPPSNPPLLEIHLESDLVPYKPYLDIVVVRENNEPGQFGRVRIKRKNANFGEAVSLDYGWRDRLVGDRKTQAGDVQNFIPNINKPFDLPSNFDNKFFNGSYLINIPHLQTGDIVEYTYEYRNANNPDQYRVASVTIPKSPTSAIKVDGEAISPPVSINLSVDTVVYDFVEKDQLGTILITWRAVFGWEERFQTPNATLEVSK